MVSYKITWHKKDS